MNVQTLPPGYKVAPWTPPEKIDSKMLADASAKLIDLLRIRTQPIGMRLFEDPGRHGEDPGRAQADRRLQVHHVPDGDAVALVRLHARHHRRQHARRQLRRRGRPQPSGRRLPVGRSHERRVVRQQGGLGRAPGADAARARRQVQRPRGVAAALGAARSAGHLPVLRHARPDDLFHQRPAVPSLPPLRLHRAPARAPAPIRGAGRSPRARPRCRCPAMPSAATAASPTTSC